MSHFFLLSLFLLVTFIAFVHTIPVRAKNDTNYIHGVDLSQPCSAGGFNCLKNNNYHFAIVRCYLSVGRVDPNCANSVKAAWAGGMSHVDIYVFPCPKCGNGQRQIEDTVSHMKQQGANYGMLWLDIEGTQYWLGDQARNRAFFEELLAGLRSTGVHAGIYASRSQWDPIFGDSYSAGSQYDLWYPHYQSPPNPSMSDFSPFGGWHKAAIKQYAGTHSLCGCGVDYNAY